MNLDLSHNGNYYISQLRNVKKHIEELKHSDLHYQIFRKVLENFVVYKIITLKSLPIFFRFTREYSIEKFSSFFLSFKSEILSRRT